MPPGARVWAHWHQDGATRPAITHVKQQLLRPHGAIIGQQLVRIARPPTRRAAGGESHKSSEGNALLPDKNNLPNLRYRPTPRDKPGGPTRPITSRLSLAWAQPTTDTKLHHSRHVATWNDVAKHRGAVATHHQAVHRTFGESVRNRCVGTTPAQSDRDALAAH